MVQPLNPGLLTKPWVHRVILLGPGQKLLQDPALGHCCSGASESLQQVDLLLLPGMHWEQPVVSPLEGGWKDSRSRWCSVLLGLGSRVPQGCTRAAEKWGKEQQLSWFELEASGRSLWKNVKNLFTWA